MVPDDRYRLAPVRDARERTERSRRGELATAVGGARTTETRLTAAVHRVARARQELATAIANRDDSASLARRLIAERYVDRCRRDLDGALGEHDRAESAHDGKLGVIDAAHLTLTRARAEREVIERHFGRWREARTKLAERRED